MAHEKALKAAERALGRAERAGGTREARTRATVRSYLRNIDPLDVSNHMLDRYEDPVLPPYAAFTIKEICP